MIAESKKRSREEIAEAFRKAADKYPGPAFSREEFSRFLGRTVSVRHLANLDSKGLGPEGGFHQGRKKMYLKDPAIKWAIRRLEVAS